MSDIRQDKINEFCNLIINNPHLRDLAIKEDWEGLFNALYKPKARIADLKRSFGADLSETILRDFANFGFFYYYFKLLDNFDVFSIVNKIPDNGFRFVNYEEPDLKIPGNVKRIGKYAFCFNKNITTAILEYGVEKIGDDAFMHCTNLQNLQLPESLKLIDFNAFDYCINLKDVTLPKSLTHIEPSAFNQCNNLNVINFSGTMEEWNAICVHEEWNGIGSYRGLFHEYNYIETINCSDGQLKR